MDWEGPSPWTCFWLKLEAEGWAVMKLSTQIPGVYINCTVRQDSVDWMTWNSGLEHWTRLEWSLTSAAADLSGWIFSWNCGLTVATGVSYCRTSVTFMHFRGDSKLSQREIAYKKWKRSWIMENGSQKKHVVLSQELLRNQFPHIDGLQSPLLAENNGLSPVANEAPCQWRPLGDVH